jgi:hypothetical protein
MFLSNSVLPPFLFSSKVLLVMPVAVVYKQEIPLTKVNGGLLQSVNVMKWLNANRKLVWTSRLR